MDALYKARLKTAALIIDPRDSYPRDMLGLDFQDSNTEEVLSRLGLSAPMPIGSLDFRIVARKNGGDRTELVTPMALKVRRNAYGYYLFFGAVTTPDGRCWQGLLESGNYVVRVSSPLHFYQDAELDNVPLGQDSSQLVVRTLNLLPGFAYPFSLGGTLSGGGGPTLLRGSLHHTDGRPLAGAVVTVDGALYSYTTDTTGQWMLVFPDDHASGTVTVHIAYPEVHTEGVPAVAIEQGRERSLRSTALRGWVLDGAGIGIPAAVIEVAGFPARTKTEKDGRWFYYFGPNQPDATVDVAVRLDDGRSQAVSQVVTSRATVLVPTFRFL